jgi:hypothetical protein
MQSTTGANEMAIRIKRQEIYSALSRNPTSHWRGILSNARDTLDAGIICRYGNVILVEEEAVKQMRKKLWQLPRGGRHVAQAAWEMNYRLGKAFNFKEGETA